MKSKYAGGAGITKLWSEDGTRVLRQLNPPELHELICSQQVMSHFKNGHKIGVRLVFQPRQATKYSRQIALASPASLSHTDSETNALAAWHPDERAHGLNSHNLDDEMIVGNEIDRVISKIEAWPYVGDNKAPRVRILV